MKIFYLSLFFTSLLISCRSQKALHMKANEYRIVKVDSLASFEEATLTKALQKSKISMQLNEETGEFEGKYKDYNFNGAFDLGKVSSGFSQGFFVKTSLGFLQKDTSEDDGFEEFINNLAQCSRLYFYGDKLLSPQWSVLEINTKEEGKIHFLRKNAVKE